MWLFVTGSLGLFCNFSDGYNLSKVNTTEIIRNQEALGTSGATEDIVNTTEFNLQKKSSIHVDESTTSSCRNESCTEDANATKQGEENAQSKTPRELCKVYKFVHAMLITVMVPFGLTGNIVSVIVLRRFDTQASTPYLLSALHICDCLILPLMFILRCMSTFSSFGRYWPAFFEAYPFIAVYGWPIATAVRGVNTWITVLVSIHRYIAVVLPHRCLELCSVSRTRKQLFFIVLLPLLFALPNFFNYYPKAVKDQNGNTKYKMEFSAMGKSQIFIFGYKTVANYTLMYVIPLGILIYVTVRLIHEIRVARQRRSEMTGKEESSNETTRILVTIVLVFLFCQIWEPVRKVLETYWPNPQDRSCGTFYFFYTEFSTFFSTFNSSINFLIYCLLGKKFRVTLRKMISCTGKQSEEGSRGTVELNGLPHAIWGESWH